MLLRVWASVSWVANGERRELVPIPSSCGNIRRVEEGIHNGWIKVHIVIREEREELVNLVILPHSSHPRITRRHTPGIPVPSRRMRVVATIIVLMEQLLQLLEFRSFIRCGMRSDRMRQRSSNVSEKVATREIFNRDHFMPAPASGISFRGEDPLVFIVIGIAVGIGGRGRRKGAGTGKLEIRPHCQLGFEIAVDIV